MKHLKPISLRPGIISWILFLVFFTSIAQGKILPAEVTIIRDPKPTCSEKTYVTLKKIKTLAGDIGKGEFLASPCRMTVDQNGNLFVYDRAQYKIFKFDKAFNFVKSFGNDGSGPGEFKRTNRFSHGISLNIGKDGNLYGHDMYGTKIAAYDTDGNYLHDYRVPFMMPFKPVVDEKKNIYIPSTNQGAIDKYDPKMNCLTTLLSSDVYRSFLMFEPGFYMKEMHTKANGYNTHFDLTQGNRLLVFIANTSTLCIFKEDKLEKKFSLWPAQSLKRYKEDMDSREDTDKWFFLFFNFFVDMDNEEYFYLQYGTDIKNKVSSTYQFNLKGELIKVLNAQMEDYPLFFAKKNQRFFAIRQDSIYVYMEE